VSLYISLQGSYKNCQLTYGVGQPMDAI